MTEKPILASTNIIVDDVWLAEGTHKGFILAARRSGRRLGPRAWWPEVGIITGVGDDLETVSGGRLRAFRLKPDGELSRDAHTIRSKLVYLLDGERTETPRPRRRTWSTSPAAAIPSAAGSSPARVRNLAIWSTRRVAAPRQPPSASPGMGCQNRRNC